MRSLLPLYLGTQRTLGGRPLMLKCLPSNAAHCSSLKSFFCLEQGSELQERNFIRRPTQYIPPFLGLGVNSKKGVDNQRSHLVNILSGSFSEHFSPLLPAYGDSFSSRPILFYLSVKAGWKATVKRTQWSLYFPGNTHLSHLRACLDEH